MKITVPKIVRELRVSEYAEEFGDLAIQVWVNPPRALLEELFEQMERKPEETDEHYAVKAGRVIEIIAELWSQGSDPETHWTKDELIQLGMETAETDPELWRWLRGRTFEMIGEHRRLEKKR